MKNRIAVLFGFLFLSTVAAATGGPRPSLIGEWDLTSFRLTDEAGRSAPYCTGARGTLVYKVNGQMSVSIRCTDTRKSFFYAGGFEVKDGYAIHRVTDASDPELIGKVLSRKIEAGTHNDHLILTGLLGSRRLVIQWRRL